MTRYALCGVFEKPIATGVSRLQQVMVREAASEDEARGYFIAFTMKEDPGYMLTANPTVIVVPENEDIGPLTKDVIGKAIEWFDANGEDSFWQGSKSDALFEAIKKLLATSRNKSIGGNTTPPPAVERSSVPLVSCSPVPDITIPRNEIFENLPMMRVIPPYKFNDEKYVKITGSPAHEPFGISVKELDNAQRELRSVGAAGDRLLQMFKTIIEEYDQ